MENRFHGSSDIPRAFSARKDACTSALTGAKPTEFPDLWLEVRKRRKPMLKALPEELQTGSSRAYKITQMITFIGKQRHFLVF